MARETEFYRDNLARIDERIPGKEMLTVADVARVLGLSREGAELLVAGHLAAKKWISKASLARLIS